MQYRPEIDGLRALAVVPVILFHAGFQVFNGGFVGVDIFFVISGYLITTILIEDIENNRFSLLNFYERRARRILPALFFVMLVCVPFAWMWMLPNQMKDFSQSLVAVSLFASNVLFWRESSYFEPAAEEKPLLHTWSLAVEEQYYLLFPIFLFLAWRYGKNRVFWMIVVMASVSFLISEWGWRNNATANFYLAPTRAWECFAGSICAFIVQKRGVRKNNTLGFLGLAAIVFSIFAYDENTPFPSLYALVPILGVVLLILCADKNTLAAKLLSAKPLVGIGLISYSAYLWHQPLIAFARINSMATNSNSLMIGLTIASLLLAIFTWKFIEQPFRRSEKIKRNKLVFFSMSGLFLFSIFGIFGHMTDGYKTRFNSFKSIVEASENHQLEEQCLLIKKDIFDNICIRNGIKKRINPDHKAILLIGDSHAASLYPELKEKIASIATLDLLSYARCVPLVQSRMLNGLQNESSFVGRQISPRCRALKEDFNEKLNQSSYDLVLVLVHYNNWMSDFMGNGWNEYEDLLRQSLPKILTNQNVVVLGTLPVWRPDVPMISFKYANKGIVPKYVSTGLHPAVFDIDAQVEKISSDLNYDFVSLLSFGCKEQKCKLGDYLGRDFLPFAYDYGHLTKAGGVFYAEALLLNLIGTKLRND